ncbi:hypothetical protein K2X83_02480 [Patescibacteria group bacterium]|nr:hypothetical protein [Patescibacteria group bacterium]
MAWKPKVIEGGVSADEPKQDGRVKSPKRPAPGEAFVLGQGGFSPVSQGLGDGMWDFLDIDKDRKK